MKDNFSTQSANYARFRPGYPLQLFDFLFQNCSNFEFAWDCATGNGQIAAVLADRFDQVVGTDISQNQLQNAIQRPNIIYRIESAETPSFPDQSLDLITVGQAAHWFDFPKFYAEVRRVLKSDGLLALVGYNLLKIDAPTDEVIGHLYRAVLGNYWDAERRHVDAAYATLPFPFAEIPFPDLEMRYDWTLDHLLGYLSTWSAVQHFTKKNGYSPLDETFVKKLQIQWSEGQVKTVRFPIFGRVGRSVSLPYTTGDLGFTRRHNDTKN